ncbi:DUF2530 domain-containing protein [Isoptericola sp. b441]|uniref:DUF2530 domain-containing protein n=1 Tax=Actinotalea lenta TaxID=3064654 RepID=A0ABT9D742_9CELL|nr:MULTISPECIES: DUF2530 domain-containing protein [unclassified Isoptericola]MDO8106667.1 DUF2530 domain-containing protein [Isoptericola sp. b441]MDO8121625.1 DUF2530 domain-containing protein [Isoptericola sp. b490]
MHRFLEPSRITPLRVDLRRVFWAGIVLWLAALLTVWVLALTGHPTGRGLWICATGCVLGFLALDWERRHHTR